MGGACFEVHGYFRPRHTAVIVFMDKNPQAMVWQLLRRGDSLHEPGARRSLARYPST
jgi:hypothetical protein